MSIVKTTLTLSLLLAGAPSYAAFNLNTVKDAASAIDTSALSKLATGTATTTPASTEASASIVSSLTSALNVTPTQATGGVGSLLALASSSLPTDQATELTSLVPGLSSLQSSIPGLSALSDNKDGVSSVFSQLGMDSSMISQFTPLILEYLTGQGASSELLSSLGTLWQ
jgi:hypothetical protein